MHRALPRFAERRTACAAVVASLVLALVGAQAVRAQDAPEEPAPPTAADLVREGNSYFRSGEYREALKRYEMARQMLPDRAEIAFNRGLTRMQLDQYAEAAAALNQALLSPDKNVEARAKFLLGNAHHRMALAAQEDPKTAINDLEQATQYYADSLALDPANDDARANIELAQRLIRQLKEMQQQQQQQSGDGEQQEQQDQEQQDQQQQQQQEQSDPQQQEKGEKPEEQQQEQQQQGEQSQEQQDEQQQSPQQQSEQQQDQQQQQQQGEQSDEQQQEQQQQQQEGQPQDAEQQEQQGAEGQGQAQAEAAETQEQQISQEQAERLLQKVRDKERQRRLERMRQDTRRAPVKKDW